MQAARIRSENARLKEQLQKAKSQSANLQESSARKDNETAAKSPATGTSNDGTNWKSECAKVSLKFNALSDNFKKAKDALRKRKEERDKWIEHATLLEKKIKTAEEEHGIQILERSGKSRRATSHLDVEADVARPSPNASFASENGLEQTDLELPAMAAESLRASDENLSAFANPTSDSTEGSSEMGQQDELPELPEEDGRNLVLIKTEPSSDTPVVVSERVVKKRKRDSPEAEITPSRRVKVESSDGSSPVQAHADNVLDIHESIDLGDVAQKILTPRKRKELEEWHRLRETQAEPYVSAPTTTPARLYVRPDPQTEPVRAIERSSALTPVSVNKRIGRSIADKPALPPSKNLSHGISTLAEDGGAYKTTSRAGQRGSGTTTPVPKGRLDALLNSPAAQEEGDVPRSLQRTREKAGVSGGSRNLSSDLLIPGRRELPFEKGKRAKENQPGSTKSRSGFNSPRVQPEDTRSPLAYKKGSTSLLRNKPASELRLEDFKINPQANEGHDFAFSEVVRDRNERACLPGCTDMHCCGKEFRALALSQRPNPPLTAAQRQEEQKLLEEYLGDYSYKLAAMNKEERDELWVEAKTQELANKYGKHRHRYTRMRSPPGFWNADFPSTQELEADRAEAGKREKQVIQERYREALKPGGRWLFRDE